MKLGNTVKSLLIVFVAVVVLPQSAILRVAAQTGDTTPGPRAHMLILKRGEKPPVYYAISIPENYSANAPVPLILALHFGTLTTERKVSGSSDAPF